MSTILVNTLTGTSTAGSIVVTGEGNSTTTNLQQGLAKCWLNWRYTSNTYDDSFNISSGTDNGTGDYTHAFSNNMNNVNYICHISLENNLNQLWTTVHTTSQFQSRTYTGSSNSDQHHFVSSNGDLA